MRIATYIQRECEIIWTNCHLLSDILTFHKLMYVTNVVVNDKVKSALQVFSCTPTDLSHALIWESLLCVMQQQNVSALLMPCLIVQQDGSKVFTASCDKTAKMWDLNSNQAMQIAQVRQHIFDQYSWPNFCEVLILIFLSDILFLLMHHKTLMVFQNQMCSCFSMMVQLNQSTG